MDTRQIGRVDYLATYQAMQDFTAARDEATPDALWICEHPAVYTQGLGAKASIFLTPERFRWCKATGAAR